MATDRTHIADQDFGHLIAWVDEQRRQDHDQLQQLARIVEQQKDTLRDQALLLAQLKAPPGVKQAPEPRPADDSAARLGDRLVLIERARDDHTENQTRSSQADAILRDRERRTIADLVQGAGVLNRTVENATGRLQSLSEEIRHERDARLPLSQALEDLSRSSTASQNRLLSVETVVRRVAASHSLTEQNDEKRASELAKLDNTVKLIEIRYAREIAEIRRIADEWKLRADDLLKPIEGIARQINLLVEQREALLDRMDTLGKGLTAVGADLSDLEVSQKSDRANLDRLAEALDSQSRRWETTGSSIWQLGERLTAIVGDVGQVRGGERSLREDIESLSLRVGRAEDDRRRLEEAQVEASASVHAIARDAKERLEGLASRIDQEITSLAERSDQRYRLSVEHLRRTVEELLQQYRELDGSTA